MKIIIGIIIGSFSTIVLLLWGAYHYTEKNKAKDEYERSYQLLKLTVNHSILNENNYRNIKAHFEEINNNPYVNFEKLAVLEILFLTRFEEFNKTKV